MDMFRKNSEFEIEGAIKKIPMKIRLKKQLSQQKVEQAMFLR